MTKQLQFLLFSASINACIWTLCLEEQETKRMKIQRYIINVHIHKKSQKVLRKSNSRNHSKAVCCLDLAETAYLKIHLTLHITVTGHWKRATLQQSNYIPSLQSGYQRLDTASAVIDILSMTVDTGWLVQSSF